MKIAIILFPGNNCEHESKRACEAVGLKADIVRWNDPKNLDKYDAYFLIGGWSYEDRIRAGVIPAKDPIMKKIKEEAEKGKVVLGVCNGAQVLVESGMIPGLKDKVQIALAPNIGTDGYHCTWVHIKNSCRRTTAFNNNIDDITHLPIAHAEGRFVTKDKNLIEQLQQNDQIMFQYCDEEGNIIDKPPINPNGATLNIAGVCNKEGNVLAMMPHPERAAWNRQLPYYEQHSFEDNEQFAPAMQIFSSMKKYLEEKK